MRLIEPTSGTINFMEKDVTNADKRQLVEIRRSMALVFQDPFNSLNPRMTVVDIIGEPYSIQGGFKKREIERNEAGELADQAKEKLEKCNIRKSTDAYGYYIKGRLPPNHIHARARRKVAKLLLAHLHHVMYLDYYKEIPPKPYVFSDKFSGGVHTKYVEPPPLMGIRGKSLAELYAQNKNGD